VRQPTNLATADELAFIGLYMGCAVMGLRMMNRQALCRADLSASDAITLAHDWYQVCRAAQEASDWLQIHSMASCQTIM
jgi:hypothetical protein